MTSDNVEQFFILILQMQNNAPIPAVINTWKMLPLKIWNSPKSAEDIMTGSTLFLQIF